MSELIRHSRSLAIDNIEVNSIEDAVAKINALPVQSRPAAVLAFNQQVGKLEDNFYDFIIQWGKALFQDEQLNLDKETLAAIREQSSIITEAASRATTAQAAKNKEKQRLWKTLDSKGKRGQALRECLESEPDNGKNFYGALSTFFNTKDLGFRRSVLMLNTIILERHRDESIPVFKRGGGLSSKDLRRLPKKAEAEAMQIAELKAEELKNLGLTIGPAGLLVEGEYMDEVFPVFDDEDKDLPPVTIDSTALPSQPMSSGIDQGYDEADQQLMDDLMELDPLQPSVFPPAGSSQFNPAPTTAWTTVDTTPRASSRKRDAPNSYAEPSSRPARRKARMSNHPSERFIELPDCDCNMADDWKFKLYPHLWVNLSFGDKLKVLQKVPSHVPSDNGDYPAPCTHHLQTLCQHLSVQYVDNLNEMLRRLERIREVVQDRPSFRRAWIDSRTRGWFQRTAEIMDYQFKKVMSDKYKSSEDLLLPVPAAAQLPEDRTIRDGVVALDCFFDWMQKKDKGILIKIFQEEIEMYRHHCREIGSDGVMHNMYHSLLMQAIRADPALYVAMVKLRADNNTRLIAFPCPGRYYAEGQNIRRCFYEGDAYSLSTTRALCDEFVFLDKTKIVTY